jgi:hypothetical protein
MSRVTTKLIEAMRATLLNVERTSGLPEDDSALVTLKTILARRIATLEIERTAEQAAACEDSPKP